MRFFEDGDLTVGLKVAAKPYPIELITGDWHIVWAHVDGNQRTTNYDEPGSLLAMEMTISVIEPADKRKKQANENLQVDMKFMQWGLEYQGHYNDQGQATKLSLTANTTPKLVEADDDAVLVFGAVRDDQDYPFLSFGTSVLPRGDPRLRHFQNMEFIAKKTDDCGIYTLELTRNERLRLGYAMDNNGVFEDFTEKSRVNKNKQEETYEGLMKQYRDHTEARELSLKKLASLRAKMDKEFLDVGISPSSPTNLNASGPSTGGVKRTASGTMKPSPKKPSTPNGAGIGQGRGGRRSTGIGRPRSSKLSPQARKSAPVAPSRTAPIPDALSNEARRAAAAAPAAPTAHEEEEEEDPIPSSPSDEEADPDSSVLNLSGQSSDTSVAGGAVDTSSGGGPRKYKMRDCDLCNTSVTAHNWGVHVNTNKHKINSGITPKSMLNKRAKLNGGRIMEGVSAAASAGAAAAAETSSLGRLKRPSAMALRGGGAANGDSPGSV